MRTVICLFLLCALSVGAARAMDVPPSKSGPDLTSARSKIKAKQWPAAVAELQELSKTHPNADVFNLLAYSIRHTGDYEQARHYYGKALALNPNHRGALQYSGQLYLKTGETDKARSNLRKLETLCPNRCEELEALRKAFEHAKVPERS